MPRLRVISRKGEETSCTAQSGLSVMEVIRYASIEEVFALCGGACACATCHVYVDLEHARKLPPLGAEENELLTSSDSRTPNSRLSCQLVFDESWDGLLVSIAPE